MSGPVTGRTLAGRGIVITRPAHQAASLAKLIETAGGQPVLFPAIEIRDVEDLGPFTRIVDSLDDYQIAIFISPNSVERAMKLIAARRPLPPGLVVATVGGGSVRALERFGVTNIVAPKDRYDSEALLEQPAFRVVSFKRVVIFRGVGGREHLGEVLRERGAKVDYAECYRRCLPNADPGPLLKAWERGRIDAVTVTSSEGLRNLSELLGDAGREPLRGTPLFVPHPRIAEAARGFGVRRVVVTGPGDDGLVTGLGDYFEKTRDR